CNEGAPAPNPGDRVAVVRSGDAVAGRLRVRDPGLRDRTVRPRPPGVAGEAGDRLTPVDPPTPRARPTNAFDGTAGADGTPADCRHVAPAGEAGPPAVREPRFVLRRPLAPSSRSPPEHAAIRAANSARQLRETRDDYQSLRRIGYRHRAHRRGACLGRAPQSAGGVTYDLSDGS